MGKQQEVVIAAVDDGHYGIKTMWEGGLSTVKSVAKSGRHLVSAGRDSLKSGIYTMEEGGTITINENLPEPEDTRFPEYGTSTLNRALVHHGLLNAGMGGKPCKIIAGLPFADFYSKDGSENTRLIEAKRANLMRGVTSEGRELAQIMDCRVVAEAVAAYIDQIMDDDGNYTKLGMELSSETTGIIDIGGKTTDIAVLFPQDDAGEFLVDVNRSDSSNHGLLKLHTSMESRLRQKFGFNYIEKRRLDEIIETGILSIHGARHDVSDILKEEKINLIEQITSGIRNKIGTGLELGRLIIVGGGSIPLRDLLMERYPHAIFPDNPEYSNVRGMYKLAKQMF